MVFIQKCDSYDEELILAKVREIFDAHGGIETFAGPGRKVAIKPNLISAIEPSKAATTHPSLVWAAAKLCREAGAEVTIVESPGGPYDRPYLKRTYKVAGMEDAAEKSGAELNYDVSTTKVENPDAMFMKNPDILTPLAQADTVISISKLKTHGMMAYTGAVKNLFGAIAGIEKAEYHMKMSDYDQFANCIIDIYGSVGVSLNILDAVVGMDRDGPTAGDPKKMDFLMSGRDAFEVDMAAVRAIKADPQRIPILRNAIKRGLCPASADEIEYCALRPADVEVPDFRINYNEQQLRLHFIDGKKGELFTKLIRPRPVFHSAKCRSCGICAKNCPAKVITIVKGKGARVDLSGCIRCYCCQELCPFKAVTIKRPLINKIAIRRRSKKAHAERSAG